MRKYVFVSAILLQVFCVLMLFCMKYEKDWNETELGLEIYVDYQKSYFDNFYSNKDNVVFECRYTIVSKEDEPRFIKMEGDFREDRKSGLITEDPLKATDKETGDDVFEIFPGENDIIVLYTAMHGSETVKQNRLLPETRIYCP